MNCKYCQTWNAEEEHRCHRCGRRLRIAASANPYPATRSAPALALREEASVVVEEAPATVLFQAPQRFDFEDNAAAKIIPFESFAAHRIQPIATPPPAEARPAATQVKPAAQKTASRRRAPAPADERQPDLEFLEPAPQGPRTLKTHVEAVIYCDADVVSPKHRVIAAAIDGGMIFTSFGIFLFTFHLMGGMFRLNRHTIPFYIPVIATLAVFYGMLWIWADRETAGMRWTGLRLIDFDGFKPRKRDRIVRALTACLGFCAGCIGLLWTLVDEEKLAWHDHISKTFPTLQESNSTFIRRR